MGAMIWTAHAVTMQCATQLRADLVQALSTNDSITIDASPLDTADLSFIQLVEAARIQAKRQGVRLALARPASGFLADLLHRAGFTHGRAPADIDFWFHGDLPQ